RARRVDVLPYSAWELVEHVRLTQFDILDFCVNASYTERAWPADYWPPSGEAPTVAAWTASIAQYHRDRTTLQRLAENPAIDLLAPIPHGSGQTYLREILLVLDHTSYHVGQLVLLRRLLGAWATA
ncbi:MAG TPA: DinB family protein, partial [Gemmatimonadaceae bacterium]|nr:DinB family protein [Gemmatimonadaceae bacterium]